MFYKKIVLIVMASFLLYGCNNNLQKGCSSEEFVKILESKGYTVVKDEHILELDLSGQMKEDIDSIHTAKRDYNHEELYVFYDLADNEEAKEIFDGASILKEEMEIAYGKLDYVFKTEKHYDSVTISNNKFYAYICRVEDKVLMALGTDKDKENINKIVKKLRY